MSGEYAGGFSVGGAIPVAASATALASTTIAAALIPAQARLAGALQALASVTVSPPSIAAAATLGAAAAASVAAAITGPTVGASAGVAAELVAELGGIVAALQASLALVAEIEGVLSTAGVHLYILEGGTGAMGGDLSALLANGVPGGSGPDQLGTAFVLVAADNGTIAILRQVFAS